MPILSFGGINVAGSSISGRPLLVIAEPTDIAPEHRLEAYRQRLYACAMALNSTDFRQANPNWPTAIIRVTSSVPPTAAMRTISELLIRGDAGEPTIIDIQWQMIQPTFNSTLD